MAPEPLILVNRSLMADSSPKFFQRGRHQAVADVADKLDGIINDLPCLEDRLVKLSGFCPGSLGSHSGTGGRWQQRAGIIMLQVGGQALLSSSWFDRSVERYLLLLLFHQANLILVFQHPSLVHHNENDKGYHQNNHTDGAREQH